jgi:hypothetical protein
VIGKHAAVARTQVRTGHKSAHDKPCVEVFAQINTYDSSTVQAREHFTNSQNPPAERKIRHHETRSTQPEPTHHTGS